MDSVRIWAAQNEQDLIGVYRHSDGMMNTVLFAAIGSRESYSFYRRFLKWIGSGK